MLDAMQSSRGVPLTLKSMRMALSQEPAPAQISDVACSLNVPLRPAVTSQRVRSEPSRLQRSPGRTCCHALSGSGGASQPAKAAGARHAEDASKRALIMSTPPVDGERASQAA